MADFITEIETPRHSENSQAIILILIMMMMMMMTGSAKKQNFKILMS